MLNSRERKTMFITSMISIAFALVIAIPWSLNGVLKSEIVVKVWVLPLIGLIMYLIGLTSKYRNYRPSVRFTTVASYFPLFSMAFASLGSGILMLVRSSEPFSSNMTWLLMVILTTGLFATIGLLSHLFYRAVIVFSKNESMLIDSVLAVFYLGVLFLVSSIANRYNAFTGIFANTSALILIVPIIIGLLVATIQVLAIVRLYIANPEYVVESKNALINEFMEMHKREYDLAEVHLLRSLFDYTKEQLGVNELAFEELEELKKEKEELEKRIAELEAMPQEDNSELVNERLLELQERLAQLQVVLAETQLQYAAQENSLKEEQNELEKERVKFAEEQADSEEEKAQLAENQARLKEEKTQFAEEQARLEEEKAQFAEEQARLEEEKTQFAEEQARLEEEKAQFAEEQARLEEEKVQQVENQARLEEEKALFQKEKDEYVPQVIEVPVSAVVETPKVEPKPKPEKVFTPSFDELIEFAKSQGEDVKVVSNPKNTQHKFMIGKKLFLIMQKTNSDYRLVFLAKQNYAMSLINKLPGAVSKPTSPKGENWFKIVNKGELDTALLQQSIAKAYELLAKPEPKPEPKVFKPTFNKMVKYAGNLPDKEIKSVPNAKGTQVKFYLGKKLFLIAQSTTSDYRLTFCSTPEQAYNLIVKYPGTVVKATSPKGEEWFKFTNKGEFDEKEIKVMIKQAVKYIEDREAEEARIKAEQKAEAARLKEEERARIKAEKEAIKLAEKEAAKARKEAEKEEKAA